MSEIRKRLEAALSDVELSGQTSLKALVEVAMLYEQSGQHSLSAAWYVKAGARAHAVGELLKALAYLRRAHKLDSSSESAVALYTQVWSAMEPGSVPPPIEASIEAPIERPRWPGKHNQRD